MADLSEIAKSLVEWDVARTEELTRAALAANIPAQEILNKDVVTTHPDLLIGAGVRIY